MSSFSQPGWSGLDQSEIWRPCAFVVLKARDQLFFLPRQENIENCQWKDLTGQAPQPGQIMDSGPAFGL